MKVRKLTALLLAALMVLGLTACGGSSQKTESAMGYNYAADMAPQEPMADAEMKPTLMSSLAMPSAIADMPRTRARTMRMLTSFFIE